MPIFEYRCGGCDSRFEELVLSRASEPDSCPDCGGAKIEKVFSTFSAQSNGSAASGAFDESAAPMCNTCGGAGPCGMN